MEFLLAVLTAVLLWLFVCHLVHQKRKRARQQAGPLLRRWTAAFSRVEWIFLLLFGALVFLQISATFVMLSGFLLPGANPVWDVFDTSPLVFLWVVVVLEFNPLFMRRGRIVEFRQRGMLLLYGFRVILMSWPSIEHCRWTKVSGRLQLKPHRAKGPDKVWIRRRDVDEATAILCRHVEVRDLQGRVLNPEFSPAGRPADPDVEQIRVRRFQFDLRTLLFFVLVASSAMSWYGIFYRRQSAETAALGRLERFSPKIERMAGTVWDLDFSASPVKPGDGDLEPVAKFTRLLWLNLTGARVTDAGLVHLEPLTRLKSLTLARTAVTDAGLVHLEPLAGLEMLFLSNTSVSDAGLKHLERLTKLQHLSLSGTAVTDAGLVHLQKLVSLQSVSLEGTWVTEAGVKRLQQALPEAKIDH